VVAEDEVETGRVSPRGRGCRLAGAARQPKLHHPAASWSAGLGMPAIKVAGQPEPTERRGS